MTSLQVWAAIFGLLVLLGGSVTALSKWNRSRTDAVVLNYMEEHARKHSGNRLQSLADITQTLGMSETLVTESLIRLRTAGKVRTHGEVWGLI
jgi:DNA-binding FadR family transcriptional regulator